jgi:hypothetical protein
LLQDNITFFTCKPDIYSFHVAAFHITVELSRRSVARDLVFVIWIVMVVADSESLATRERSALVICSAVNPK